MDRIDCIVETPAGYNVKYTYDHELGSIGITKILPAGLVFPFDFGFIHGTKGEDGDPLDIVLISEGATFPGCTISCRIIGAIKAEQRERNGKKVRNDRFLGVPGISMRYKDVKDISDLPREVLQQLEKFFINYNEQAGKQFKPLGTVHAAEALRLIAKARKDPEPNRMVQLFLPLTYNNGKPFPERTFTSVKQELTKRFGGVTVFTRSPAEGVWKEKNSEVHDEVVIFEVMVSFVDLAFWKKYKTQLQSRFRQDEILIRHAETGVL